MNNETSPLDAFFSPTTVAVIGATEREHSVGRAIMTNMQTWGQTGTLVPVNPKHHTVFGSVCFSSVLEYPDRIDLAIIAIPARHVAFAMEDCAKKQIPAVIIISAGFKELGTEGKRLEEQVMNIARKSNIRVIGPNCLGVINPRIHLNASFARAKTLPGSMAFISQSGALCAAVLDWGEQQEIGFSVFASVGDMADVDWGDVIEYFGNDPQTKSMLLYMETVGDPRSFLSASREVSREKPIVVIKPGRSQEAAKAALSHTGALVGDDAVFDAACEWAGVLRVECLSQLFETAEALAWQPRPSGPRLAIVTNAGGPSVLATDAAVFSGVHLSSLSPETKDQLRLVLPPAWGGGNPIDILGDADSQRYKTAVDIVLKDPSVDGALVVLSPQEMTNATQTAESVLQMARQCKKPVLTSWMGGESVEEGRRIFSQNGIPCFAYPDDAARCFGIMWKQAKLFDDFHKPPRPYPYSGFEESHKRKLQAQELLKNEQLLGINILSEKTSKKLLKLYNIPVVETFAAKTQKEAVDIAEQIGYPIVMKIDSPSITHKTDVGGVFLDIRNANDLSRAFSNIQQNVRHACPDADFLGVTVQKMIEPGIDVVIGCSSDPQFGPVILFGAGGEYVELFGDYSLSLPPLHSGSAKRMIEKTKISRAFSGFRGHEKISSVRLEDILIRFSEMIIELPEIFQCDMNPVRVSAHGCVCLDARIVLGEKRAMAVCSGYLQQYASTEEVEGEMVCIRPIRSEDAVALIDLHERLSASSSYIQALCHPLFEKQVVIDQILCMCWSHVSKRIVFVAERNNRELIAVVQLVRNPSGIWDLWWASEGNSDVERRCVMKILAVAKERNIRHIQAIVPESSEQRHVLLQLGFCEFRLEHGNSYLQL